MKKHILSCAALLAVCTLSFTTVNPQRIKKTASISKPNSDGKTNRSSKSSQITKSGLLNKIKKKNLTDDNEEGNEYRSPFRYVIVNGVSRIERAVNDNPDSTDLEVLMEDAAFNEENLKTLFQLLGKRFSSKPVLGVRVYTSLEAIRTPEENDRLDLYGPIEDAYKYKNAFFLRDNDGEEWFKYSTPDTENKEVILKKNTD